MRTATAHRVNTRPTIRVVALSAFAIATLSAVSHSGLSERAPTPGIGAGRATREPEGLMITSISCPRARHCWAVGSSWQHNVALRWRGSAWVSMPMPAPKAQVRGETAMSLSCPAMNDCWAVEGTDTDVDNGDGGSFVSRDAIIHWNGTAWVIEPAPNPTTKSQRYTFVNDAIQSVSCPAATLCWAVGYHDSGQLALRWNGRYWHREIVPLGTTRNPNVSTGAADLESVFCVSDRDCWAGGRRPRCEGKHRACHNEVDEVLHWTGGRWEQARLPKPTFNSETLTAVACASRRDCWAVGPAGQRNQGLHWNGRNWLRASIPSPQAANTIFGSPGLSGLTCFSNSMCWAVGTVSELKANTGNEVLQWNGRSWRRIRFPQPDGDLKGRLYGASCDTQRSCWAVGGTLPPGGPAELLHWNGRAWHVDGA